MPFRAIVTLVDRKRLILTATLVLGLLAAGCSRGSPAQSAVEAEIETRKAPTEGAVETEPVADAILIATPSPETDSAPVTGGVGEFPRIETIEVLRHGIDLPTFLDASVAELERDTRIRITSRRVDGNLHADGLPVSVIDFVVSADYDAASYGGRQYAIALPDDESFLVVSCLAELQEMDQCDDAVWDVAVLDVDVSAKP
jgi:hypothetical protein